MLSWRIVVLMSLISWCLPHIDKTPINATEQTYHPQLLSKESWKSMWDQCQVSRLFAIKTLKFSAKGVEIELLDEIKLRKPWDRLTSLSWQCNAK